MLLRRSCLALLAAALISCGGCATRVNLAATAPSFADDLAAHPQFALGGVVVGATVGGRLAPADADDADQALYRAFLGERPDLVVWPTPAVDGRLAPGQLDSLRHEYAALGRLRPDQVQPLAAGLEGMRFLVLVRITADQIRSIMPAEPTRHDQRPGAEGVPENSEAWGQPVRTERQVALTLQVFDLADGAMVWEAAAESRDRRHYAYADPLSDQDTYVRDRLAGADDPPTVSREGVYLQTPDLVALLEQALAEAVQRLPRTTP
ncbi:MAG: hypothetical protein R3D98_01430 [Candidatus Krumholzibacteriia bacterium]